MKHYMVIGKGHPEIVHDNLEEALKEARKIASREGIVTKVVEVVKEVEPERWSLFCIVECKKPFFIEEKLNFNHKTTEEVREFLKDRYPTFNFKGAVAESNRGQIKFFKLKEN